jgi:hypothetical protein
MKKLIALVVFALPMAAQADYVDVVAGKLNAGCTLAQYLQVVSDFNEQWAKDYGYRAEVLVPLQSRDMDTIYWVGRIRNAEAFGKGLDAWRAAQSDPNSTAAKLMARLRSCTTSDSRAGFASY